MTIRRRLALAAVLGAACNDAPDGPSEPATVRDQSGAEFAWKCDEDRCAVEVLDLSPPLPHCSAPSRAIYSYTWGLYLELTAACADDDGFGFLPEWGRLVVCDDDADCPSILSQGRVDEFGCNAGYCKNLAHPNLFGALPPRWTMELICFGDRPRYEAWDDPERTAAIEAACPGESSDSQCFSVPSGCPDPRG